MREALAFLTVFGPASGRARRPPGPSALRWFPVVGALIGLGLGGLWWVLSKAWPWPVAAALVVGAELAVTGMLHLDGLVDSADGLLPHMSTERRLEVMAEAQVGAFGVGTAAVVLLLRWLAISFVSPAPLLLAGLWCLSRSAMAVALVRLPYARAGGGLASTFRQDDWTASGPSVDAPATSNAGVPVAVVGVLGALALASVWKFPAGLVAVVVAMAGFAAVVGLARRRIGGFTGDVLGAAGVVAETVGLVVAAARW